jgi:hypothetical protein
MRCGSENTRRMQKDLVHQAEYGRVPTYSKRHDRHSEHGKAWTLAEIPAAILHIAQDVIDVIHAAHIAAFLLMFHSVRSA